MEVIESEEYRCDAGKSKDQNGSIKKTVLTLKEAKILFDEQTAEWIADQREDKLVILGKDKMGNFHNCFYNKKGKNKQCQDLWQIR